ncbi:MAG TPA: hypothetical protein VI072_27135 [Polyangiaceae bacterium]
MWRARRWRTSDEDIADKEDTERRIEEFWRGFSEVERSIRAVFTRAGNFDLAGWMQDALQGIDSELMWEFGPAAKHDGHRLIVTPESRRDLRPLAEEIVRRAPSISGWEFYAYRLAEDIVTARATVQGRCGSPTDLSSVAVVPGADNQLDLVFRGPSGSPSDSGTTTHQAFVLAECLLGEEILDKWIGFIDAEPDGDPPERTEVSLEDLQDTVRAHIEAIRRGLPERPYSEMADPCKWTLLELKPQKAPDYAEQHDLFIARTPNVDLWRAAHAANFCDERFSRHGEVFCYLKLDGSQPLEHEKFADKAEIEDALDAALKPLQLGGTIGGGSGLRYSYIELALLDIDRAISKCRRSLAEGGVPLNSWLLFHNPDLEHQWVGIYDETPPPPANAVD